MFKSGFANRARQASETRKASELQDAIEALTDALSGVVDFMCAKAFGPGKGDGRPIGALVAFIKTTIDARLGTQPEDEVDALVKRLRAL